MLSFVRSDGRTYYLVLNARALTDRQKQVIGCVVTLTDFTGRKQAEEEVRRSEERFRLMTDAMPALVWTIRPDGVIDYVNRQFLQYTGSSSDVVGAEGYSFPVHPDDRAATDAAYQDALRTGEPYQIEHRLKRFDGVYRWYLCRSIPVRDAGGRIIKWYGTSSDINDLRETQEKLRESEAKFRWLFDSNLISTIFWNTTGKVIEANEAFCHLIGCTPGEIRSGDIKLQDVTPSELMPRDYEAWAEIREHGSCQPYEKEFTNRADGRRVPVLITGGLLAGSKTNGIGFAIDLSERKRMEEALRSSEATLKVAIEATAIGTFDFYPQTGELLWSDLTRLHFGLPPEAPVDYRVFLAGVHPADREHVHMMVQSALAGENDGEYRIEYRTIGMQDGKERWVAARGRAFFNEQGEPVRFIGTTLDITERKRVEEELRLATEELERRVAARTAELAGIVATLQEEVTERIEAEESLRKSEALLKTVLDTLPVAVWVLNKNGEVVAVNPAGKRLWAGERFQPGQPEVYKGWRHDTGQPIAYGEWGGSRAVTRGDTTLGEEYDIQCFDGSRKVILYSAVPLRDKGGQVIGAVVVNEDISGRISNEQALQAEVAERLRALEELRRKDRLLMQQSRLAAMGEMIGNIAHQWRQPLNTLGLIVQGLSLQYEMGDLTRASLDAGTAKAMQVISHMSGTIDDFRNFFRPDKEKVPFKVNDVVANTVSLVDASFRELQLHIEVAAQDELFIFGYPNEYSQVLLNILLNARDAFVERKVNASWVGIRISREDGKAVVTITDNAGGIPDEIMERIFDPYFTTKGPDKGTGIGLFMAKTIIEKNMNGRLSVRNTGERRRIPD